MIEGNIEFWNACAMLDSKRAKKDFLLLFAVDFGRFLQDPSGFCRQKGFVFIK